jgi:hypothetical protein
MKNLKSENGSITSLVIVTVLFFVTILSTSYMVVNALRKSQLKSQINAKDVYERDLKRVDEIVAEIENRKNQVWPEPKEENETINGEVGNAYNPTIPAGYIPINTDSSKWGDGTTTPTTDAVEYGLVIKDKKDNEWVWIPVPDVTVMCDIDNTTEEKLCTTKISTSLYSKNITIGANNDTKTVTRTTPGQSSSSSHREPDLVTGLTNSSYDTKDKWYKLILGDTGTIEQLAKLFVDEYEEMLKSINKYGRFYVGRYELSEYGVQKNKETLTKINWYNLYNKCKSLNASDKVKTRMMWGCQWDVICDFISKKGEQKSITKSKNWGNYADSTEPANTGNYEAKSKKNTGSNEAWKANNIYDLAGNCREWTQEAFYKYYRANRGGDSSSSGDASAASNREALSPDNALLNSIRYSSNFNNKIIKPN